MLHGRDVEAGVQPRVSTGRSIHAVPSITPSPREGIEDKPRLRADPLGLSNWQMTQKTAFEMRTTSAPTPSPRRQQKTRPIDPAPFPRADSRLSAFADPRSAKDLGQPHVFLGAHHILAVRPEPRSDLQGLGVFNCPAIERRGCFYGQSRCNDKGDKRADGTQKHCRNEGGKGGVIREAQSRAADTSEDVLQDTSNEETDPAWLVGERFS